MPFNKSSKSNVYCRSVASSHKQLVISQHVKQLGKKEGMVPNPQLETLLDSGRPHPPKFDNIRGYRSIHARQNLSMKWYEIKASKFVQDADCIKLPFSIDDLKEQWKNPKFLQTLQQKCDKNFPQDCPSIAFSTIYVDRDNKVIFAFAGHRSMTTRTTYINWEDQYKGWTVTDFEQRSNSGETFHYDGLADYLVDNYHIATQKLSTYLTPKLSRTDHRHHINTEFNMGNYVIYPVVDSDGDIEMESDENEDGTVKERSGVHHLVHGWETQGHSYKGLKISSDMVRNAGAACALPPLYLATDTVTSILGSWASGGEFVTPQLEAVFRYAKGDFVMGMMGDIFHKVQLWSMPGYNPDDQTTPGRCAHVFFSPRNSVEILETEDKGWGRRTGYGSWEEIIAT
ncbi:hypothetical protein BDQ12DRAFT_728879 [Crucibulum laeve]|uniref:Uncharacterized protein n=1 Tax=Crucibulum laeve TaxID=68775 RepID=A0A5C3LJ26_9AGAR|nr:hypothetical protein BDQ12DRAFT_728879 [Crucibulum laeve]